MCLYNFTVYQGLLPTGSYFSSQQSYRISVFLFYLCGTERLSDLLYLQAELGLKPSSPFSPNEREKVFRKEGISRGFRTAEILRKI